jgi:predicted transcriptional regulator
MDSIQLLTRRGATCSDLLSCLYNLKPIDLQVFLAIAKNENATLDQIAQQVQRDRSSTHRCLSKLVSAGLVHKQSKTLKGGGYYHVYSTAEPAKIKEHARQRVKEITNGLESLIANFESDLCKRLEEKTT